VGLWPFENLVNDVAFTSEVCRSRSPLSVLVNGVVLGDTVESS
jgi:hypothetical protein